MNPTRRGLFILFEGLDRCGKTTQAHLLHKKLLAEHKESAQIMHFPDRSTIVGQIINEYLQGQRKLDDHALHLLFTANRWELAKKMETLLKQGVHLIVDRYIYSGVAFSAAKGLDLDWCLASEHGLVKPDIVFYMNLGLEKAAGRGEYGEEVYENVSFQGKVRQEFQSLQEKLQKEDPEYWQVINADRSIEDIHTDLMGRVDKLLEDKCNCPISYI